ncbi:hypothetical protein, unknown function [Leishmania tarentolae]|uniref:Uncharacterized protein n=1 Tax=Leishmania tarentolae TaxID=5689 RepID=A0A640KP09_LEITA|nr:hypothetical protein, unknown function [Leishmania tarentolae]
MYSDTSVLDNTTPPCRTYSLPLLDEGAPLRWGSGTRVVKELNTVASAGEGSKADHMLANSRPTMAVPIVAPMYLEDTTSTEVSTHERSNELTQQPSTATSNSVPLSSHFPRTDVLQDCSNEHNQLKPSKTQRGASRTPQCHTAASQGVVGAPFSARLLDKAGPRTPVATSDGSAVLVPLKAPTTVVASSFVVPGGHSRKCGSSDSVHSPPRTSEAETPVFRTEGLESWVAGLPQRTWRTSNRSISPDALLNAPSLAARLNHPEKPVHTSKQLSSAFEARSTSSPGMVVQQPYHTHARARFFEEKHATGDTSASCPEALASRETLDNGDRGTEDLQISDASSSFSVGDCSSLPSLTSTVDPRLSQLLEPCVNKTSPGQVGGQHRGCGTSVGVCL